MTNKDEYNSGTNEGSFPQMESLRKKAVIIGRVSWASFALYPIIIIIMVSLDIDIGAGGALSVISWGLFIVAGPWIIFLIFRKCRQIIIKNFLSYTDFFKSIVVEKGLEKVFENTDFENPCFESGSGWSKDFINNLKIFKYFNIYDSDDRITSKHKNFNIDQADVNLIEEHEETYMEDGKRETRTVRTEIFCGRIIKLEFNSHFPGELRIIGRGVPGIAFSSYSETRTRGKTRTISASMAGWETMETESVAFNEKFFSFSLNPTAALTFLKPQTIIKFLELDQTFKMPMAFYFRGKDLFVFQRNGGTTFELSLKATMDEQERIAQDDIEKINQFWKAMADISDDFINSLVSEESVAQASNKKSEPLPENVIVMEAEDADLSQAPNVIVEGYPSNLGGWQTRDIVRFCIPVKKAGRYSITLHYSKKNRDGDHSKLKILVNGASFISSLPYTGSGWDDYTDHKLGELDLPVGDTTFSLASSRAIGSKGQYVMNLRSIKIAPVE